MLKILLRLAERARENFIFIARIYVVILTYFGSRHLTRIWSSHLCWIWAKTKKFTRKKMICSKTFYFSKFPTLNLKNLASFSSKFVTKIDLVLLHSLLETLTYHVCSFSLDLNKKTLWILKENTRYVCWKFDSLSSGLRTQV